MDFIFSGPGSAPKDKLVRQIVDAIEAEVTTVLSDPSSTLDGAPEIELECRLGIIQSETGRLNIPTTSETIIANDATGLRTRFEAGIPTESRWLDICHAIKTQMAGHKDPFFTLRETKKLYSRDEFFPDPTVNGRSIRTSTLVTKDTSHGEDRYNDIPNSETSIHKDHKLQYTVWTGKEETDEFNESADTQQLDWRLAVNVEVTHRNFKGKNATYVRHRERESYVSDYFQVDCTVVVLSKTEKVYELELELNPQRLVQEVKLRMAGKPNEAETMVAKFLQTIRQIAALANSYQGNLQQNKAAVRAKHDAVLQQERADSGAQGVDVIAQATQAVRAKRRVEPGPGSNGMDLYVDLNECVPTDEKSLGSYLQYVSPVLPLIGDYLFRAVAPVLEAKANNDPQVAAHDKDLFGHHQTAHGQWTVESEKAALAHRQHTVVANRVPDGGLSRIIQGGGSRQLF